MLSKNTSFTIGTKVIILLTNFAIVVLTTHLWGSEGRGEIALVIANISLITIFSNVFCGSTIAYHVQRQQREFIFFVSIVGAMVISLSGAIIFSSVFGFKYFWPLLLISFLLSLTTAISTFWLGENNIRNYNLMSLSGPLLILISLLVLFFIFKRTNLGTYYLAYLSGTGIVLILGIIGLAIRNPLKMPKISITGLKALFDYGIKNELSYFIQFLNYRLSYYFIAKYLGLKQLGIFSIVVSITEAVWIISRSMSVVHFSNVINTDNQFRNRTNTKALVNQSFIISSALLCLSLLIPDSIYAFVFGNEFVNVRILLLYLLPGTLSIAVSNLYGHYFSGTGQLKIVIYKSLIGLLGTLITLPFLIIKYQLSGVCIALNASYILSSFYLWYKFRNEGQVIQYK